ncbi:hypothetical protein [uncultured Jatrophihabitans sp.]
MMRVLVRGGQPTLDAAVDGEFATATAALIRAGWTPVDIYEVVRR